MWIGLPRKFLGFLVGYGNVTWGGEARQRGVWVCEHHHNRHFGASGLTDQLVVGLANRGLVGYLSWLVAFKRG